MSEANGAAGGEGARAGTGPARRVGRRYPLDRNEVGFAGQLDELGCELRRLQQETRRRAEVLHQVARVARAERNVALATIRRDPLRGLRIEGDLLLLAYAPQDLGELLVGGRLDLDLVLNAPEEGFVDER